MSSAGDAVMFSPDPDAVSASQATAFMRFCQEATGHAFADDAEFYKFSVAEMPLFWQLFLEWSDLRLEGSAEPACTDDRSGEDAAFFPNLRLSYVENLLRCDSPDDARRPAVIAVHESRPADRLSRGELRDRVLRVAGRLQQLGIGPGDRVVAVARNNAETVVAGLATLAVGATFSSVAPEMGIVTILDRFEQLAPRLLFANLASDDDPVSTTLADRIGDVARALPSLIAVVAIDDGPAPTGLGVPIHQLSEFFAAPAPNALTEFKRFPFNHPLFVLFSSGTTGPPKCIVHGAGGTLLEHVKEHRLHCDLRSGDTLFFQTSTAWMMWNWQLSALASGATIVVYDGPLAGAATLWRIVDAERVTVFGTSPPYLQLCADSDYSPRSAVTLSALRAVLSTGSILHAEQYEWVRDHVGAVPLQSISGGTDIIGCFVLGHPNLPVHRGKIQARSLGFDVRALHTSAAPTESTIGELVCTNPFPSRPLGFVGDDDGVRFHDAYYSENAGVWTHGDLVEIDGSGQVRMHGRSDGVLNIHGVRIGPAEIYRVLRDIPEIHEAIAVEQRTENGPEPSRIVLVVVLRDSGTLDDELTARIRHALASKASPAHVPHLVVEVDELPATHSGKRSERAVRDALDGVTVANEQSLANPNSLSQIVARVADADAVMRRRREEHGEVSDLPMVGQLRAIWEEVLGIAPLALDDNFFEVGGTSLAAVRLLNAIRGRFGIELPLSILLHSPTIEAMAAAITAEDDGEFPLHVLIKPGRDDRPLFIVHSLYGDILYVRTLALEVATDRAIYGLRSRGLDGQTAPYDTVEEMAAEFAAHVRRIQPVGPYAFVGHSFGGLVAFEMAQLMVKEGECVDTLMLIDTYVHHACLPVPSRIAFRLTAAVRDPKRLWTWLSRQLKHALAPVVGRFRSEPAQKRRLLLSDRLAEVHVTAFLRYRPLPYSGRVTFVEATVRDPDRCDPVPVWRRAVNDRLRVVVVEGGHDDIVLEPNVRQLADHLTADLRLADQHRPLGG